MFITSLASVFLSPAYSSDSADAEWIQYAVKDSQDNIHVLSLIGAEHTNYPLVKDIGGGTVRLERAESEGVVEFCVEYQASAQSDVNRVCTTPDATEASVRSNLDGNVAINAGRVGPAPDTTSIAQTAASGDGECIGYVEICYDVQITEIVTVCISGPNTPLDCWEETITITIEVCECI